MIREDARDQVNAHRELAIRAATGSHLIWQADSATSRFRGPFDLVICSPPYFNPAKNSQKHGVYPKAQDINTFARWTAQVLVRTSQSVEKSGPICFVKTDVKYKGTLLQVGFRIADECEAMGLRVQAHWVWERQSYFSPYAPSVSNIFVLGGCDLRFLRHPGIFRSGKRRSREYPSSFTPGLFEQLIRQLTAVGGTVLDPFVGLGSTMIGASRSGRWSVGVEISSRQIARAKRILESYGVEKVRVLAMELGKGKGPR